jgi:hypothetical protein
MVLERMFPCRFLAQIEQVASTTVCGPHIFDIVGKSIQIANHLSEGPPQVLLHWLREEVWLNMYSHLQ